MVLAPVALEQLDYWRLMALPCDKFEVIYSVMQGRFWRYVPAVDGAPARMR